MMAGVAELLGRGGVALWASWKRSYVGACMASPAAWIAADLFLVPAYLHVMKDLEKLFGETKSA